MNYLTDLPVNMKHLILLFAFFFLCGSYAQQRIVMSGLVKTADTRLENVHIKNVSSGKFSISDVAGEFHLSVREGDTILLSHVSMNDLISFIKKEDLQQSVRIFRMSENSSELREVVVDETSEVSTVSVGIIPRKRKKLSMNERRLKTAGDFKPIHLLGILGGSLQIDPILNAINGRTKRLKRNIKIEKKQQNIAFLEMNYMDYMMSEMELSEQQAQLLISRVIEDEKLQQLIDLDNQGRLELYLLDSWFKFQSEISTKSE